MKLSPSFRIRVFIGRIVSISYLPLSIIYYSTSPILYILSISVDLSSNKISHLKLRVLENSNLMMIII